MERKKQAEPWCISLCCVLWMHCEVLCKCRLKILLALCIHQQIFRKVEAERMKSFHFMLVRENGTWRSVCNWEWTFQVQLMQELWNELCSVQKMEIHVHVFSHRGVKIFISSVIWKNSWLLKNTGKRLSLFTIKTRRCFLGKIVFAEFVKGNEWHRLLLLLLVTWFK